MIRLTIFLLITTILSLQLEAQNIVQNGSGEDIESCPSGWGQLSRAEYWFGGGTVDLYNRCGQPDQSVPTNFVGFQEPHDGDGYFSFLAYDADATDSREYVQNELRYPLVANETYYVEFYVSLIDKVNYSAHNIGVTLTELDNTSGSFCSLDCPIYFENTSVNSLNSKTEWIKIGGTFIAQGGERYLHIANFRRDAQSEVENVGGGLSGWNQAYYYIDDVWLSHIDSMGYVGVNEELGISNDELRLYPNPATDVLNFSIQPPVGRSLEVTVVDFSGREILTTPSPSLQGGGLMQLDVSGWPAGIYLLSIRDENGNVVSKRVVKE